MTSRNQLAFVCGMPRSVDSMEHATVMRPEAMRELASMVIKPGVKISPQVQELLESYAKHIIDEASSGSARLASHRGSEKIEAKDVLFYFQQQWNMEIPGFSEEYLHEPTRSISKMQEERERKVATTKKTLQNKERQQLARRKKLEQDTKVTHMEDI